MGWAAWSFSSHVVKMRKLPALCRGNHQHCVEEILNDVANLKIKFYGEKLLLPRRMKTNPIKGRKKQKQKKTQNNLGHSGENIMQNSISLESK